MGLRGYPSTPQAALRKPYVQADRRERGQLLGPEVRCVSSIIAEGFDYLCAVLVWMVNLLTSHGELELFSPSLPPELHTIYLMLIIT